jgi:hypothetical protein
MAFFSIMMKLNNNKVSTPVPLADGLNQDYLKATEYAPLLIFMLLRLYLVN